MADVPIENPMYLIMGDDDPGPEEEAAESVVDLRPEGGKGARVTVRLSPRLTAYIQGLAASNDRSIAAEIEAALEAHELLSRLSAVLDQDLQQRRWDSSGGTHGIVGKSASRFAETLRNDLARIWATSFGTAARHRRFAAELMNADVLPAP